MLKKLGNYLLTGALIALPLTVTVFVAVLLIRNMGTPVSQIVFVPLFSHFDAAFPHSGAGKMLLDFISTLIVLLVVTGLGVLSQFFLGKMLISYFESLMRRIPIAGVIYRTVRQIVDTFSKQKKAVFQKVVLVEFPRKGLYSIGFLTGEAKGEVQERTGETLINIFVPTTPNPTSGFLVMVDESGVIFLDMSVGDAMKLIISGGAVVPEWKLPNAAGAAAGASEGAEKSAE
ncbi:MAG: hypothetical protein DBX55_02055 [Verrucomicrobia bacterium]|nr:MAG: hypothetical protein DBX55_02055 [Verrucomicrobiota bacterium]